MSACACSEDSSGSTAGPAARPYSPSLSSAGCRSPSLTSARGPRPDASSAGANRRGGSGRDGRHRARGTGEVVLVGVAHGGAAVGDAELAVDVGEVELDRVLAEPQVLAYRLGRATVGDSAQDRGLARRELRA